MKRCLALLLLLAITTHAQDRQVAGRTDRGRAYTGTVRVEAGTVIADVDVAGLGRHTLRAAAPATGRAPDVRLLEREGGLIGALGGGPGLDLVVAQERSGFASVVDPAATGAYFRKVTGPRSPSFTGLVGRGRLPTITFDPNRYHRPAPSEAAWLEGPLDRPSVYLGGRGGGFELDAGLTWDRVHDAQGRPVLTDREDGCDGGDPARRFVVVRATPRALEDGTGRAITGAAAAALRLRPAFAFRVFWRTTGATNAWHNPRVGSAEDIHLYPGQPFAMRVEIVARDRVRLVVRGEGALAPSVTVTFDQPGFGRGEAQAWKRVSSIDQFREVVEGGERLRRGNEGRPTLPTRTRASGMTWFEVHLLRADGARTPLAAVRGREVRGADNAARYGEVFRLGGFTARGGEELDIVPPSP